MAPTAITKRLESIERLRKRVNELKQENMKCHAADLDRAITIAADSLRYVARYKQEIEQLRQFVRSGLQPPSPETTECKR